MMIKMIIINFCDVEKYTFKPWLYFLGNQSSKKKQKAMDEKKKPGKIRQRKRSKKASGTV